MARPFRNTARSINNELGARRIMRISVCMATYNGASHVHEQLVSILDQIGVGDQVVVVDDASVDDTVEVIENLGDPRVQIVRHSVNRGHVKTFEHAMSLAQGEVIFLADQDDIWAAHRVEEMLAALGTASAVTGNYAELGSRRQAEGPLSGSAGGHGIRNLLGLAAGRRAYYGSCMAFRREILPVLLPFPPGLEAHDHWIAIVANLQGRMAHCGSVVTYRRIHGGNLSRRRSLGYAARTRMRQLRLALLGIVRLARR